MNTPSSSNSFASTVDLSLRPSYRAFRAVFALHFVCLTLTVFSVPAGAPMMALATAFGLSWLWVRRHPALGLTPQAVTRIVWHADGNWTLHRAQGEPHAAALLPGSLVHPWLLVLRFRLESGVAVSRVILGDETDADALRRLRARLSVTS